VHPAVRRLLTRGLAIVPAVLVTALAGSHGVTMLLLVSQVVLSLQLSFAAFPLLMFTSSRAKMGEFVNRWWVQALGWLICLTIAALNGWLLIQTVRSWSG
jgi:manganese transport protein